MSHDSLNPRVRDFAGRKPGWRYLRGSTAQCGVEIREATYRDIDELSHALGRERIKRQPRARLIAKLRAKITELGGNPL